MLTSYDALTAGIFERSGVVALLVGDSAGMVIYGHDTTVPVTPDMLLPLVQGVVRGTSRALVVADLPFASYHQGLDKAMTTAARFMQEGGAHAVKLEGGRAVVPQVQRLVEGGVPVMGHVGLMPQSVHVIGGMRQVKGRGDEGDTLLEDARALEDAGAFAIVAEAIPSGLGERLADALTVPVVGIGAGPKVDAQILVWQDMAGLTPDPAPRFVRRYADLRGTLDAATRSYVQDVLSGNYPAESETY